MKRLILTSLVVVVMLASVTWGYLWWTYIRIHGSEVPIEFASADGVTLRGALYLPTTNGPHPGVVFVHGAGPETADGLAYVFHLNAFLKKGIAVLLYDKRGAGRSDGDFDTATYDDFIEDVLAGVRHLRQRREIDGDRIGLLGSSEGGWLTPEIAVRDGNIAFVVNRAGPPLSWMQTNLWEIRNELIEGGITDPVLIEQLLEMRQRIWSYYIDATEAEDPLPARRETLQAQLDALGDSWREALPMRLAEYDLAQYRLWVSDIAYDPQPFLRQLRVPLLAVFAQEDQYVPTREALPVLEQISDEGLLQVEIVVYPDRRHSMLKWYNFLSVGYPPSYLDLISDWAAEKAK